MERHATYKAFFIVVGLFLINYVSAKEIESTLVFKIGDRFEQTVNSNSKYIWEKGDNSLPIEVHLSFIRLYKVQEVTEQGYSFSVNIKKITDTVYTEGRKKNYTSEHLNEPESMIEKAIKNIINKSLFIQVDKKGAILSVKQSFKNIPFDSALASFAGLEQDLYVPGRCLGLFLQPPSLMKINDTNYCKDFAFDSTYKANTSYKLDSVTDSLFTIKFSTQIAQRNSNSNINGVLITDQSGIILTRLTQSITIAYKTLNGIVYSLDKRTAMNEQFKKL